MRRRLRQSAGQTAAEYMGVLLVVAVMVAGVVASGAPGKIAHRVSQLVCEIAGHDDCGGGTVGDADGDGVSDGDERRAGTDPKSADSDGDGVKDGDERKHGTDPLAADTDGDGLTDQQEARVGSDPRNGDTDGDSLSDGEEVAIGTDPKDEDGDGFDTPGDGLTDAEELEIGSDPNTFDTDGDGNPDGYEVDRGDDPTSDERNFLEKGFDTFILDDPIGFVVTLGAGKLASGPAKVLAGRLRKLSEALKGAKTVEEAARIRRQIIAAIRDKLGRYVPGRSAGRVPQGISKAEFEDASRLLHEEAGSISDDIRIHGSRAAGTARADSDLDVAILVDDTRFNEILERSYGRPNPGSAKERSLQHAAENGKIPSGEAGLRALRKELEQRLGKDVHISIVRRGGPFDQGPYIPIP